MGRERRTAGERVLRWAVVGVGTAGRARGKAIRDDPRARLVHVWRGRYADELAAPFAPSFEAALRGVDAVAISSPTRAHADQVRAALEAGLHVVCEYPLAEDAEVAESLFALARAAGRVLHEEHIELLDPPSTTLGAHIRPETVTRIEVSFERPGVAAAEPRALSLGNVARLHRALAVGGDAVAITSASSGPGTLVAELSLASGATLGIRFEQAPHLVRRTRLQVETVAATWEQVDDHLARDGAPVTLVGSGSLFRRDQLAATARVLDGAEPYVGEARLLHVMDLVERLAGGTLGPVPHRSDARGVA